MKKTLLKSSALLTTFLIAAPIAVTSASAATSTYTSNATVTFQAGSTTTPPVDPTNPGNTVDPENPDGSTPAPGTNGPLSIDFASSLSFGTQDITATDATYYAHAQALTASTGNTTVPDYVQVTDTRGTFAGWTLQVNTDSQFHLSTVDPTTTPESTDTTPGDYLTGAELDFTGGYVGGTATVGTPSTVTPSLTLGTSAQTILAAKANEGMGTWIYGLGAGASGTTNSVLATNNAAYQENGGAPLANTAVSTKSPITLKVPGSTAKKAAAYTTDLVWTLSDTPGN